ncbi:MAG: phosphate/phosphite/phosphonate ABC transporter substrate-binding protein [Bacilli bacterium]|nr:phosphate/phosphite/phosphonate ABC transporter substrate-binding protein [Bacilli bacterium]
MRRISKFLLAGVAAVAVLAACTNKPGEKEKIIVRFVPSSAALADPAYLVKIKSVELMLEEKIPNTDFELDTATNYEALTEAMISGQVDVGFLTSQQYAYVTTEEPGKVDVILSSVRNAYAAQIDDAGQPITDLAQIMANVNAPGYNASYHDTVKVSSYHSMLLVKTSAYEAGFDTVAELEGKKVATGSTSSGSGYVYPAVLLNQNGLKFTSNAPGAKEVQSVTISGGHQSQIMALLNDEVDAAFAFLDARLSSAFDAYNAVAGQNVFADTKVIALTTGIYNDTISVVNSMAPAMKEAIQKAFMEIIKTEVGLQALSVYNHTGYNIAVDSDYDGEREVYVFKRDNL